MKCVNTRGHNGGHFAEALEKKSTDQYMKILAEAVRGLPYGFLERGRKM
jgi:hypothetical protein